MFFFIGFFFVCLTFTLFTLLELEFFSKEQSLFIYYQFPVFRASLVICFFVFVCGFNVLVWEKYQIQYKSVLKINIYYSTIYHLFKSVFIYFILWILIFLYCTLSFVKRERIPEFLSGTTELYLPPLLLVFMLMYLLNPLQIFNYKIRAYGLRLFTASVLSLFLISDFVAPFTTD